MRWLWRQKPILTIHEKWNEGRISFTNAGDDSSFKASVIEWGMEWEKNKDAVTDE